MDREILKKNWIEMARAMGNNPDYFYTELWHRKCPEKVTHCVGGWLEYLLLSGKINPPETLAVIVEENIKLERTSWWYRIIAEMRLAEMASLLGFDAKLFFRNSWPTYFLKFPIKGIGTDDISSEIFFHEVLPAFFLKYREEMMLPEFWEDSQKNVNFFQSLATETKNAYDRAKKGV
jgi:hypothetical protein